MSKAEKLLKVDNLYDLRNVDLLHGLHQALRAHHIYKKDVDYLIKGGEVVIIDEFTDRIMEGRRWSNGLHQAMEAKENVKIKQESETFAAITFQNYFRIYEKLAGMTGTAETEEVELGEIYGLDVSVIPPNRPMIREDHGDVIFVTQKEKWNAVVEEVLDCHSRGQPVLVGTASIEKSEMLSEVLKARGLKSHVVLNAKFHDREAEIVAQAGRRGAVTIATNMAGRGTDIVLGGNPEALASRDVDAQTDATGYAVALEKRRIQCAAERREVLAAGGLHILGTERHESRRIDNQLRGRSGRQGDPGSSRFYLSLEDDLMRLFGTDRFKGMIGRVGMEEGRSIEHKWVSKAIQRAQSVVESEHFSHRKNLLGYDDVMNKQRSKFYALRREFLRGDNSGEYIMAFARHILDHSVARRSQEDPGPWLEKDDQDTRMLRGIAAISDGARQ